MKISISGQHMGTGDHLQNYSREALTRVIQKYFAAAISADVHFAKQGREFLCTIVVNYAQGSHNIAKSNYHAGDIYTAFDTALVKLEQQLRKHKSILKNHHTGKIKASEAMKYIITPTVQDDDIADEDSTKDQEIISEQPTEILTLSINQAIMRMDLQNLPALVFKNIDTDRINAVYYRKDGNISWIDSK